MEAREMVEELKRLMMYRLVGGLNIKDSMAYILGQLVFSTGERPSFRRAGIFLLDEEAGRKVLETRYEWKDRGFVELEYGAKIPLDKEGDGTAHIAREALKNDSKIPLAFFVDNVQSDPRTNKGYSEYNSCAWTSIHGPDGKLLGVLWADARDEHSITDDMMRSLADVSREAGGIISMTQKISGGKRHHQGDISVFERPPTGDHVLSLMSAGWSGFASNLGGRASHGVIIAGGNRFTGVVGVGVRLHSIPDGSTLLIVDPADSRLGYVVCSPTKATLDFFGLTEIGQQVSIEPESVDIHDAVTKDGFRVHLMGSLQGTGSEQLERYVKYGAEGVGLFRTEMAMINDPPSFTLVSPDSPRLLEDYFYDRYRNLVGTLSRDARAYRDAPIIFRLIDVAPNKYPQIFRNSFGDFDMLQSTGLRFLLEHKQKVLAPQLNAVSRVADDVEREGPKIMVMTSNVQSLKDWVEFRDFMRSVRGERFSRPVGCVAQLETPGVINEIPHLLKYVDGIAFGTNDLTVRTLGLPGRVGVKHDEFNPQVLRTLKTGVDSVLSAKNTPCMICGCLAESPEGVAILIGMGVEHISVPPRYIPEMRRVIPGVTQADCKAMLDEILTSTSESLSTPKGVHEFVRRRIRHS